MNRHIDCLTTSEIVSELIERLTLTNGIEFIEDKPRKKVIKLLSLCDCDEPEGLSPEPTMRGKYNE